MEKFQYNVIFRPEDEGGFTALVPSLPGCISYGKDLNEAKKMIKEAIELYIESLEAHKEPIPNDSQGFLSTVNIKMPRFTSSKLKYA